MIIKYCYETSNWGAVAINYGLYIYPDDQLHSWVKWSNEVPLTLHFRSWALEIQKRTSSHFLLICIRNLPFPFWRVIPTELDLHTASYFFNLNAANVSNTRQWFINSGIKTESERIINIWSSVHLDIEQQLSKSRKAGCWSWFNIIFSIKKIQPVRCPI